MLPTIRLLGHCDITVGGNPITKRITRKLWYVFALIATSPTCQLGRVELTEAAWPLSDDKTRNVLLYMWRRSFMDAIETISSAVPVLITETHVAIDPTAISIDFHECSRLAKIALCSEDALAVRDAGLAFDALAGGKILLQSFPSAFVDIRREFDTTRKAVLRRAWQAQAHCDPTSATSSFEMRLRELGDSNPIGTPSLPFSPLLGQSAPTTRKAIVRPTAVQLAAATMIGVIFTTPIVLGLINTPSKDVRPIGLSRKINKPNADLSNCILFQLSKTDIKQSLATAITRTPSGQIIVAGNAIRRSGMHQTTTAMLDKSGKVRWLTMLDCGKGLIYTPAQVLHTINGRTFVASQVQAEPGNIRRLAPGSYLSITTFAQDGNRIAEQIHPDPILENPKLPIRLTAGPTGGAIAFANASNQSAPILLHAPANSAPAPGIQFPATFLITDAITNEKSTQFILGYIVIRTAAGIRRDWHVQALNPFGKALWSKTITGAVGLKFTNVRGTFNGRGDLVAYGSLPSPDKRNGGRLIASMVTLSPTTGAVIQRDHYDSESQNPDFALCNFQNAMASVVGVTQRSPNGSEQITIHRFGNEETDTALTLTVRLPRHQRVDSVISLNFDSNGALNALLRPTPQKSSNVALTYVRKYYGREVSTGSLSASVPHAYIASTNGLVAGHYNNSFCVYNFSQLP